MPLHLTKVAYGHDSIELLRERVKVRAAEGAFFLTTRYLPKRHGEIVGGSLYWIIKHRLLARSPILGFGEADGGKTAIHLEPRLVLVEPRVKRAHQGWRYLEDKDAPPDLAEPGEGAEALPAPLAGRLAELALI